MRHEGRGAIWFRGGLLFLFLSSVCLSSYAQKKTNKFEDAKSRSQEAARIIELLSVLPTNDLPIELVARAQAIAVFPTVTNQTGLFISAVEGHGVISARTNDGWTTPAFYKFVGGGYVSPFAKNQTRAVLFLFLTKDAVAWFEKGGVNLKNGKKAIEGPVGTIGDEELRKLQGAHMVAYEYYNGTLTGKAFGNSFWKNFFLDPDNKINKPLYGMKGREILVGKEPDQTVVPEGIAAFKQALQKRFPRTITSTLN